MRRIIFIVALSLISCDVSREEQASGSVKDAIALQVQERGGVSRREVVTSGIPFPKGRLQSERLCRIIDENNTVLECEKSVLVRWPDGSVKWLLLDFPLRLEADKTKRLTLQIGETVKERKESPLRVESGEEHFIVYTGALRVSVNRKEFTMFEEVALPSGDRILVQGGESTLQFEMTSPGEPQAENWLVDAAGGTRETALAQVQESEIEFQNTQRVVIRIGGFYRTENGEKLAPFWTRYTFWKNSERVGVEHFFAVDADVKKYFLRTARLRLRLQSARQVEYGVQNGFFAVRENVSSLVAMMPDRFYHNVPWDAPRAVHFEITGNNKILTSGEEASGVVSVAGENGNIAIAMRDFSRLHPKEIRVDMGGDVLDYYLWPEHGGKVLDLRRRYDELREEGQYDRGRNPQGGRGVGKTHQLLFDFSQEKPDATALTALAGSVNEPLRVFADAEHYNASGVFGAFHPVDNAHFPRWEAMLRLQLEYVMRLPHMFHWDGLIDWGDTLLHDYEAVPHKQQAEIPKRGFIVRGYDGWLNNDTNIAREMLIFFLRSQDRRLWEYWERMVMHVMDVDTVHGHSSPRHIGAGRRHDQQHWGSLLCGYGTAAVESSDYYYLTGSLWGREMAIKYADWYLQEGGSEWPTKLAAIVRAYELTGEKKYHDFLLSPACLNDPQLLKLGSGKISALDNPSWRTVGTETGVDLLWQLTGEKKWQQHFIEATDNMLSTPEHTQALQNWGLRTLAIAYLHSGEQRFLDALLRLIKSPSYDTAEPDYFQHHPDLNENVATLDFETLAQRSLQIRRPGPSVRTIIYTYRVLPVVMAALNKAGLDESSILTHETPRGEK